MTGGYNNNINYIIDVNASYNDLDHILHTINNYTIHENTNYNINNINNINDNININININNENNNIIRPHQTTTCPFCRIESFKYEWISTGEVSECDICVEVGEMCKTYKCQHKICKQCVKDIRK